MRLAFVGLFGILLSLFFLIGCVNKDIFPEENLDEVIEETEEIVNEEKNEITEFNDYDQMIWCSPLYESYEYSNYYLKNNELIRVEKYEQHGSEESANEVKIALEKEGYKNVSTSGIFVKTIITETDLIWEEEYQGKKSDDIYEYAEENLYAINWSCSTKNKE